MFENEDDSSAAVHHKLKPGSWVIFVSLCPSQPRPRDPLEEDRRTAASQSRGADGGGPSAPVQRAVWGRRHLSVRSCELQGKGLPRCPSVCGRWEVGLLLLKETHHSAASICQLYSQQSQLRGRDSPAPCFYHYIFFRFFALFLDPTPTPVLQVSPCVIYYSAAL